MEVKRINHIPPHQGLTICNQQIHDLLHLQIFNILKMGPSYQGDASDNGEYL